MVAVLIMFKVCTIYLPTYFLAINIFFLNPYLFIYCHPSDMESARCAPPQPKIPSPSRSAASKGEQPPPLNGETAKMQPGPTEHDVIPVAQQTASGKAKVTKAPDVSEATYESRSMMEPASQGSARPVDDEVQQKQVPVEAGNISGSVLPSLVNP